MSRDSADRRQGPVNDGGGAPTLAVALPGFPLAEQALALAQRLGIPIVNDQDSATHVLAWHTDALELRWSGATAPSSMRVDFGGVQARRWRVRPGRDRELVRAIGWGRGTVRVVDATAGLGRDAFLLACSGLRVHALERVPLVAALLEDGLRRACADDDLVARCGDRLTIESADARAWLERCTDAEVPDAVYLDPMYPTRRKRAAVKKEMQVLQQFVGTDADADELLAIARRRARRRVVVKRPKEAPPLAPGPDATIAGARVRFDIYLCA